MCGFFFPPLFLFLLLFPPFLSLSAAASRIYFGGICLKKINKNINIYNFHLTQHWEKLGKTATKTQKISQKYTFETSQQIEKFGLA